MFLEHLGFKLTTEGFATRLLRAFPPNYHHVPESEQWHWPVPLPRSTT